MGNRGFISYIIVIGIFLIVVTLISGVHLSKVNFLQVNTQTTESPTSIQASLAIPSPSPNTNIFENELFSFEYPNGWKVESDGSLVTVLKQEDDSQTPGCFINIYIS